jgi:hypothetical protein
MLSRHASQGTHRVTWSHPVSKKTAPEWFQGGFAVLVRIKFMR